MNGSSILFVFFLILTFQQKQSSCLGDNSRSSEEGASEASNLCSIIITDAINSFLEPCSIGLASERGVKGVDSSRSTSKQAYTESHPRLFSHNPRQEQLNNPRQEQLNAINNIHDKNKAIIENRCFSDVSRARSATITLVSSSTDNIANYAASAYAINSIYAITNSYYFEVFSGKHFIDYEPVDRRWHRVKLLYEMMLNIDSYCDYNSNDLNSCYLVWVDSDLIFLNSNISIHSIIEKHKSADIIISAEYHAETGIANTGCFIIKKSEWSLDFLHDWWHNFDHSVAHDQIFFDRLYKILLPESARRVVVLPINTLNSLPPVELTQEDSDNVLHLMGVEDELRENVFEEGFSNICKFFVKQYEYPRPLDNFHVRNVLQRYRLGEGLHRQLGLTRAVLQRIYSNRYDELLLQTTDRLVKRIHNASFKVETGIDSSVPLGDSQMKEKCQSVFNLDAYLPEGEEAVGAAVQTRGGACVCAEVDCMVDILDNLSGIREILLQNRMLVRSQQSNNSDAEQSFAQRYYGDVEFLVKLSTLFAGRLLYRLGGSGGTFTQTKFKYKETKALKTLLLQSLHFSAVTSNDFIDSYHQLNSFNSEISLLNFSRFSQVTSFQKYKATFSSSNMYSTDSISNIGSASKISDETDNIFKMDLSGAISIWSMHSLLEFFLDVLLQMISFEQLHLIEEMVLSYHASVGTFYASRSKNLEKSRFHFAKAHEFSLRLIRSRRGNLYQLLQPYLLWGRSMHDLGQYQESFDALLELFCVIDSNELVLLDQTKQQQQLSEEHSVLAELYFLNAINVREILNGRSEVVLSPAVNEICSTSSHGVNRAHKNDEETEDLSSSSLPSIDMSGFYIQATYWNFKLQYMCDMIRKYDPPHKVKFSSFCLEWKNDNDLVESSDTVKTSVKKIHRRRRKKEKNP